MNICRLDWGSPEQGQMVVKHEDENDHKRKDEDDDDDDKPLASKKGDEGGDDDDDESEGEKKSGRKERRGRDKRKRDKDKRKKEGKKSSDSSSKKKGDVVDDAILDKCDDPHEVMEVYGWPMPLPDDAGRIRAYNVSSMTQEFWETYEEYFKPVTEEAVKSLLKEPDLDNDSSFTIPKLGVHWAQRSGGKEDVEVKDEMDLDGGGRGAMSSGRGAGTKRKASDMSPNVVGGDGQVYDSMESKLQTQKMTMRMLACFLHQDGIASSSDLGPHPSQLLQAAAESSSKDSNELLDMNIERRMRIELTNLGLMESPDIEYDQPHIREDDQICAELRRQQKALRQHLNNKDGATSSSRKALLSKVEQGFQLEKSISELIGAANQFCECFLPKLKLAKGVKPQDIRKHLDNWDKAYNRYKQAKANPAKRKATSHSKGTDQNKVPAMKPQVSSSKPGQPYWMGGAGGSAAAAKSFAQLHSSMQRR